MAESTVMRLLFYSPFRILLGISFFSIKKMTFIHSTVPIQEALLHFDQFEGPYAQGYALVCFFDFYWLTGFFWVLLGCMVMLNLPWDQRFNEWRVCFFAIISTSIVGMAQSAFINIPSLTVLMLWRLLRRWLLF